MVTIGQPHKGNTMGIVSICYLVAVILAALATFGVSSSRFSLGWAAITFIALGMLFTGGFIR